jgi:hypothetical protein
MPGFGEHVDETLGFIKPRNFGITSLTANFSRHSLPLIE